MEKKIFREFLNIFMMCKNRMSKLLHLFGRFINARRRIVQPMIDASNRAGKSPVVTVFKSRRRKNSLGQGLPSPGPRFGPPGAPDGYFDV